VHLQDAACERWGGDDAEPMITDGDILALVDGLDDEGQAVVAVGGEPGVALCSALLMGSNGMMGRFASDELELAGLEVRRADSRPPQWNLDMPWPGNTAAKVASARGGDAGSSWEWARVDISDGEAVLRAAAGTEVIVNLSVDRREHGSAFAVNCAGPYNCLRAALACGHKRFINTTPHFAIAGAGYEDFGFGITEDAPAQPGVGLYALTKGLGLEVCRVFARTRPIEVVNLLFYNLPGGTDPEAAGSPPFMTHASFAVTFPDAARALRRAVEVPSSALPDAFNAFFISAPLPHGKFSTRKARDVLGWVADDSLRAYFTHGGPKM
jgi:hypothetical protein